MTAGLRLPPLAPVAALGAAAVFVSSAGDVAVATVLVLVAFGPYAGAAALGAVLASVARWGTADLGAIAGDQAVLGAALTVGPVAGALSSGLAGVALLLVARPLPLPFAEPDAAIGQAAASAEAGAPNRGGAVARQDDGWLHRRRLVELVLGALPCGVGAAALAAGPAATSAADLGVRVGASIAGVALAAFVADRRGDTIVPDVVAIAAGALALVLAVVA